MSDRTADILSLLAAVNDRLEALQRGQPPRGPAPMSDRTADILGLLAAVNDRLEALLRRQPPGECTTAEQHLAALEEYERILDRAIAGRSTT